MFKRIKNLLEISRYTVEELKSVKYYQSTTSGYLEVIPPEPYPEVTWSTTSSNGTGMATIINMHEADPFKSFENDTSEQSPDDTAARN